MFIVSDKVFDFSCLDVITYRPQIKKTEAEILKLWFFFPLDVDEDWCIFHLGGFGGVAGYGADWDILNDGL